MCTPTAACIAPGPRVTRQTPGRRRGEEQQEGGAEGDTISVLNEQSKRAVQGTIVGPGRVMIRNGSPQVAASNAARGASTSQTR